MNEEEKTNHVACLLGPAWPWAIDFNNNTINPLTLKRRLIICF